MTAAILLKRKDEAKFQANVSIRAKADWKTQLEWLVGSTRADDPVLFDPTMEPTSARYDDMELKMGDIDLQAISKIVVEMRLVMHLWRHPELASLVHKLDLYWFPDGSSDMKAEDYEDDEQSRAEFIDHALQEIYTPEEEDTKFKWSVWLRNFGSEAWFGVLLVRLTHLESIEFGHERSILMPDILLKAANRQQPFHETPPFPSLREVIFKCEEFSEGVDENFVTPFFYFPSVRSIRGHSIWANTEDDQRLTDPADVIQSTYSVREITVKEIWYCGGMLDWLAACRELEHLSLQTSTHPDDIDLVVPFNAMVLYQALLPFKQTLKSLSMIYEEVYNYLLVKGYGWTLEQDNIPFGSFRDFSVLEDLTIRHAHLMQIFPASTIVQANKIHVDDMLPSSLRKLTILDIVEDFSSQLVSELQSLVRNRNSHPHLVTLELGKEGIHERNAIDKKLYRILKAECEEAGIYLKLIM
ncbi:uncharacterized protein BO80DRAFT_466345 [Aspergillus ibericus CBS 121593]|uniref:F-box domain protein n=1 Tax=Aspergillus ibericus CBS 121593 TaxID=1448316 RepID=A0A395GVH4_9EURO|nr:hypothetical protein BO80DRAFT_466345 [Aspergillus ibericus CBS 121593]RAK99154.1 hypothetical protein BO80DRAFT_466345 [Aspergillus ibericus CBS 121593]